MNKVQKWFLDLLPRQEVVTPTARWELAERARPLQYLDQQAFAYASGPNFDKTLAMFALSVWVNIAVRRLAVRASSAKISVQYRSDPTRTVDDHPLLQLIGKYGIPNDYQDSLMFRQMHHTYLELAGNSYWYWFAPRGGAPTEVHLLDPNKVRVIPGDRQGVRGYEYTHLGRKLALSTYQITHFKGINPYDVYYGMAALEAIRTEVQSDRSMALWNAQFFGENVGIPTGVLVIPSTVSDAEMERVRGEFLARHGGRRETAIIRSEVGGTVYIPAGAAHKDLDFKDGRLLSRQAVYECLDLPMGSISESSTEAHARVAERQGAVAVNTRTLHLDSQLTTSALPFWRNHQQLEVQHEDLTQHYVDWDREEKRHRVLAQVLSINERRKLVHYAPLGREYDHVPTSYQSQPDRGHSDPVQPERQVPDVVEPGEQTAS